MPLAAVGVVLWSSLPDAHGSDPIRRMQIWKAKTCSGDTGVVGVDESIKWLLNKMGVPKK